MGIFWSLANYYVFSIIFAALIESDAEGIGGSGFVECIREHIHSVSSSTNGNSAFYFFSRMSNF